jgi:hypothetical protein
MIIGVNLSIDVTKINKEKLYVGVKGTYLNVTTFVDTDQVDRYGNNGIINQSVSKEERESGVRGAILGNNRMFSKKPSKDNSKIGDDIKKDIIEESLDDQELPF